MGLTYSPSFRIEANDNDITATIADRFSGLSLSDETGFTGDTMELTLADNDDENPVRIPPRGAELRLWLGYDGDLVPKGLFVAAEVELTDSPGTMTITARAAPYEGTPKGKTDFATQKTRSWPKDTTLGAMVRKMAAEHGMEAAVSEELASIPLPQVDQSAESDINLLVRMARRYDAIAKPAGGKLIFAKRGNAKTVSGADLPTITLERADVIPGSLRMRISSRDSAGTVLAFYRDNRAAKRHMVTAGTGDPVKRIRSGFKNLAEAKAAVEAELSRRARGQYHLSFSVKGRPELTAEANLTMGVSWRDGIAGDWIVTSVRHHVDSSGGYTCDVEAEKPNDDPDVEDATSGDVTDQATGVAAAA